MNAIRRSARCTLVVGALVAATLASPLARSQDIEVFSGNDPSSGTKPNVLIIIDNTSNWSSTVGGVPAWDPELTALANTINGLNLSGLGSKVRVGLMMFVPGGVGLGGSFGSGNGDGGYVRYSIRDMNPSNAQELSKLALGIHHRMKNVSNAQSIEGSNNAAYSQTMAEAYYYFFGKPVRVGYGDDKRDCETNTNNAYNSGASESSYNLNAPPRPTYAYNSCGSGSPSNKSQFTSYAKNAGVTYVAPPDVSGACQRNFIVFISNGPIDNSDNSPGYALLQAAVKAEGAGSTTVIPVTPNGETASNYADEWARFLNEIKNVQTYTINANDKSTGQALAHEAMMRSMAIAGGGDFCKATDPTSIQQCLDATFNKILAVNSVFASVTLPVSVNPQLQNLDQVYMGMFRPDAEGNPRWFGNLKQYKLAVDVANNLFLADAAGNQAIDPVTGQVYESVSSYWTTSSTYWAFQPRGSINPNSDSPDGRLVEKGGAAQRLRTVYAAASPGVTIANRKVFTCVACNSETTLAGGLDSSSGNTSFSSQNAAGWASALRVPDSTSATSLIKWVRGENTEGEKTDGGATEARPSIHGDVLHSRPTVYTVSDTEIYLFYGSNDGMIHAIRGGRGTDGGNEVWSFVPEEFFPRLNRLQRNTPVTWSFETVTTTVAVSSGTRLATVGSKVGLSVGMYLEGTTNVPKHTFISAIDPDENKVTLSEPATANISGTLRFVPEAKPIFADGPLTIYKDPTNDKVYLFAAFRRGGRFLYAFDITNPTAPKYLWRKGCGHSLIGSGNQNGYGCDDGYGELGLTFSELRVARVGTPASGENRTVLIFGAGYDPVVEDPDPTSDSGRSMGRGVFVVDAYTGTVLEHIRPSKMDYAIPSDVTLIDFDRNGFVDRMYVGDTGGQVWRIDTNSDKDPDDWTVQRIASLGHGHDSASSGDGNRRKFLFGPDVVETAPGSGIFAILLASGDRENPLNGATGRSNAPQVTNRVYMLLDGPARGSTVITESQLDDRTTTNNVNPSNLGWYITLSQQGEKGTGSVITLGSTAYFGTNYPTSPVPGTCQNTLGNARFYTVDFLTAGGRGGGVSVPSSDITANRYTEVQGGGLPPSPVGTLIQAGPSKYMEGVIMGTKVLPVGPAKVGDRFRNFWYKKFDKK